MRARVFGRAAHAYWLTVFPVVCRQLARWTDSARAIPDPRLRAQALLAAEKRGNMEGAAAFAAFVPPHRRLAVIEATVAFQTAYNYLDILSEQPNRHQPFQDSWRLHQALLAAVDPCVPSLDYYEHHAANRDAGHLTAMIAACRAALAALPSYEAAAPVVRRATERVVGFQAHQACGGLGQTCHPRDGTAVMARWARAQTPAGTGLCWWETAAAAGSSMGVHALIAAAAHSRIDQNRLKALERVYFPWIGALHSLLDHLIDIDEDRHAGQRNLTSCYASAQQGAERMGWLARQALRHAGTLAPARRHELIVAAMASFYLSCPQARQRQAEPISNAVAEALEPLLGPPLAVFRFRRTAERLYYAWRAHGDHHATAQTFGLVSTAY